MMFLQIVKAIKRIGSGAKAPLQKRSFMENTKIFSFLGLEHEDIPYYIAQALTEKNKNVLVIDNSVRHNLFLSLNRLDEEADSVEAGKAIFLRNKGFSENNFKKFDCVIIYHGMNPDFELLDESDINVLVLDYLISDLREISKFIDYEELEDYDNLRYLFKDRPSGKVSEKYIKNKLRLYDVEEETSISLDESDVAMRTNFQYNGIQPVKGLSSEMRAYVNSFVDIVAGKKKKKEDKGGDE